MSIADRPGRYALFAGADDGKTVASEPGDAWQIVCQDRDVWKRRALAAEAERDKWCRRATFNASDVGLLRFALRRVADGGSGGVHDIAREALAGLEEREARMAKEGGR